jgi:hypothetical protein
MTAKPARRTSAWGDTSVALTPPECTREPSPTTAPPTSRRRGRKRSRDEETSKLNLYVYASDKEAVARLQEAIARDTGERLEPSPIIRALVRAAADAKLDFAAAPTERLLYSRFVELLQGAKERG